MLRPETEKLWAHLKDQKALRGFVLAGGTALSMHLPCQVKLVKLINARHPLVKPVSSTRRKLQSILRSKGF